MVFYTEGSTLWKLWRWLLPKCQTFKQCFNTPAGRGVLIELAPYCHANAPCNSEREQGRRDVWLFIQQRLEMDPAELTVLFAKLGPEQRHQLWNPSATYIQPGD